MTRWNKIRTVASFEFLTAVKRPGYLIATFGMPLFVAAYAAVVAVPAYYASLKEKETTLFGVVDPARILALEGDVAAPTVVIPDEVRQAVEAMGQKAALAQALGDSNFVFRPFAREAEARSALARRDIKAYFVLAEDYLQSGRVDIYSPDTLSISGSDSRASFGNLIRERLVQGRVEGPVAERGRARAAARGFGQGEPAGRDVRCRRADVRAEREEPVEVAVAVRVPSEIRDPESSQVRIGLQ